MDAADCQALGEDVCEGMCDLADNLENIDYSFTQEFAGFNFRVTIERLD